MLGEVYFKKPLGFELLVWLLAVLGVDRSSLLTALQRCDDLNSSNVMFNLLMWIKV